MLRRDRELQQALQQSIRAGDLLLKAEEQELRAVDMLAKQLLQSEYRWVPVGQQGQLPDESFRLHGTDVTVGVPGRCHILQLVT